MSLLRVADPRSTRRRMKLRFFTLERGDGRAIARGSTRELHEPDAGRLVIRDGNRWRLLGVGNDGRGKERCTAGIRGPQRECVTLEIQ